MNRSPARRLNKLFYVAVLALGFWGCSSNHLDLDGPGGNRTYSIGGRVTGLDGTLILSNGADDLTVTDNGAFAFNTELADGTNYAVTITSRPRNQYCALENASGRVAGSDVTNINVSCTTKAWVHPDDLLADNISADGQSASTPHVATDNNGNAIIVWHQSDGTNMRIYKSEYRNGSWTNPADLNDYISPDGSDAMNPQVAMDDDGNAIIVWEQYDGTNVQIFKSEYRSGTWTDPADLMANISPDGGDASRPRVGLDNNGNALIVWYQHDGAYYQIFKSEYRNGTWTDPADLTANISPDGGDAYYPEVSLDNNGNALIVWYQHDGAYYQIFKSEYRNGTWTDPADLTANISPDGGGALIPKVAVSDNGSAVIVWYQDDGLYNQIFKSEYRNGTWTDPADLTANISPDGQTAYVPDVAMDSHGNAVIAWYQYDGANYQIFRSEFRNGSWSNPADLTSHISISGQDAYFPQVAMDDNGDALIVWYQNTMMNNQVFMSEFRSGSWTDPSSLTDNISPDGQDASQSQVSMDDDGNAIIVWQQYDGTNTHIYRSEYR